ncbi:uncharacterized protein Z518_00845 [Rhinocladiella mackenziei CBS 650.93]|uniref:Class II aldolase/adducin N-terminal domain-containing protein n=1 Tax=Rhinocladiella mackenziei CBS 650.93 TaxID=1442369 RepID=A0A0D2IUK2_9EURO|nr:uncharacterized protein Z518_00845 [Rhinocladiella mackenziei CBS 650.93]KIX09764.1 hypothetical protein Z518_00845 [Rhinocladiella mackenziei CBS 650.93]
MASTTADEKLTTALRDLISANHILHHHSVVDAYGHVSIRHPTDPSIYIMCGYMAPAMVSGPADLIQYRVSDSGPADPNAPKGYSERFIHGELFKRFPAVNCVIHSHAEEVLPYVVTGVKLRAVYHMSGFLGSDGVKVFDIDPLYETGDQRDMLVNNPRFGAALAEKFASGPNSKEGPDESVVLMRRHGFTCVADNIVTAVYRAIYTRINAEAQTKAMAIAKHVPLKRDGAEAEDVEFAFQALTKEQHKGCSIMCETFQEKPWRLWVREVERLPLYENELSQKKSFA